MKNIWQKFKRWIIGLFIIPTAFASTGAIVDNNINPYIENPTRFEIQVDKGNEGIERASFAKNKAKMTLGKWSDEIQMGVEYKGVSGAGKRKLLSNKLEWQGVNEKVRAYPLTDGYEFEIELAKKPATNTFDFEITGAENLDFFYQPALTQQEIDDGAFRPDNVIGSYAVYHKTKKNYRIGSTNYANGKAYHVYTPKIIDANGDWVWGKLDYKNGVLSVTAPWSFLNTAVYPVIYDPTFGYTTAGGSDANFAYRTGGFLCSVRRGFVDSTSENGTLDSLSYHVKATDVTETIDVTIFINEEDSVATDSHGQIAISETIGVSITTSFAWKSDTFASESITSGTNYIINVVGDGNQIISDNTGTRIAYDTGVTVDYYAELKCGASNYTDNQESPWVKGTSNGEFRFSIYATYTASGGGGGGTGVGQDVIWFD